MISAENKKNKQLIEKSNLTIQNLQAENDQLKNDIKNVNSLKNQIENQKNEIKDINSTILNLKKVPKKAKKFIRQKYLNI